MNDRLFVIAIGGTGMRCLEAFVHLCAIGMFDNEEINILTLDTDQSNGNKGRVERLIELYNKVKTDNPATPGGSPNANTYFSAKLNLYRFYTDYSKASRSSYAKISATQGLQREVENDDRDLADLFLDHDTVQSFNLDHGYRAQTHLGSMLMYHGIIEAARHYIEDKERATEPEKQLAAFLTELQQSGAGARVFVFGSVFGGTGASSIPVVPEALKEAVSLISQNTIDFNNVKFGATLLTEYFSFNSPSDAQRRQEKLVATSDYFAINSQAALQFYQQDRTVKDRYKRLYHVGWPAQELNVSEGASQTITGGAEQKNACHVVELMCACAAYDFFGLDDAALQNATAQYLYRSVELDDNKNLTFKGTDFVSARNADEFLQKMGSFLVLAHIILSMHGGALPRVGMSKDKLGTRGFISRLSEFKITDYNELKPEQTEDIDKYMKEFAYNTNAGALVRGWIYQVYNSVRAVGASKFLFAPKIFEENISALATMDPCKEIQEEKKTGLIIKTDSRTKYDDFVKNLPNSRPNNEEQSVSTMKERFLAHMYRAINATIPFSTKL